MNLPGPGPGRPKGSVNKISARFSKSMEEIGLDVALELNDRYIQALADKNQELAVKVLCEMASYIYPKLKAMEHTESRADDLTIDEKIAALKQMQLELEAIKR